MSKMEVTLVWTRVVEVEAADRAEAIAKACKSAKNLHAGPHELAPSEEHTVYDLDKDREVHPF